MYDAPKFTLNPWPFKIEDQILSRELPFPNSVCKDDSNDMFTVCGNKKLIKIYQKMYIDNFIAHRSLTTTTFKNLALKKEDNLFSACQVLTRHVLKS